MSYNLLPKMLIKGKGNIIIISSAASRFVLNAVSSIFLCFVYLPEFISIETKASVWLITRYPPDFKFTVGLFIPIIFFSKPKAENRAFYLCKALMI